MRTRQLITAVFVTAVSAAACTDDSPTAADGALSRQPAAGASFSSHAPPPILIESLTGRHEFTDEVATQLRVKYEGRPREVINIQDASNLAVLRITVQPGARFPWHSHPGSVMVAVTTGELVYVHADDCVERSYAAGTAFLDPGFDHVHIAFNPSEVETVLYATFLGVPAAGPLTIPVGAAEQAELNAKCGYGGA